MIQALRVPRTTGPCAVNRYGINILMMNHHIWGYRETPRQDADPQAMEGFYNSAINCISKYFKILFQYFHAPLVSHLVCFVFVHRKFERVN